MTASPSKRRRRLLVGALALLVLIAAVPTLLSVGPLTPVTRWLLTQGLSAPLSLDGASLSWGGPQTLEGISIGGRGVFRGDTAFHAQSATLPVTFLDLVRGRPGTELQAEDAELHVIRDAAGGNNLLMLIGEEESDRLVETPPPIHLVLTRSTIFVEDRATGTSAWLRDLELELDTRSAGGATFSLSGRTETPTGIGAIDMGLRPTDDGGIAVECVARGVDAAWFTPVWEGICRRGAIGGRLDLDLNAVLGPGPRFDVTADGTIDDFLFQGWPWTGAQPMKETFIRCSGGASADFDRGLMSLDAIDFQSSFFALKGNGRLEARPNGLFGDATLRLGVGLTRASQHMLPLVRTLPVQNVRGHLDVELTAADDPTRRRLAIRGEHLGVQPAPDRYFPIGTSALYADVAWTPSNGRLSLTKLRTEAAWLNTEGAVDVTLPGPDRRFACAVDLDVFSPTENLAKVLHVMFHNVPLGLDGELKGHVTATVNDDSRHAAITLGSDWFNATFEKDQGGDRFDLYNFFGQPFDVALTVDVPSDAEDWLAAATGRLDLDSEKCSIYRNEFEDFILDATLADGVVTIENWRAKQDEGTVAGTGALTIAGAAPAVDLQIKGSDLRLGDRFTGWFAACVAPVFAARPGPYAVKNDVRMSGEITVEADGLQLNSILTTLRGRGTVTMTGSDVTGSALLDQLTEPYGEPGSRRIEGIESALTFVDGRIHSLPIIHLPGGESLRLTGSSDAYGTMDFRVSARSIFGDAFVERHRDLLPEGLFRVEGRFDRPEYVLPNPTTWRTLAAQGRIAEAIRGLRKASPP